MPLIQLVVVLIVIGVLLWLVNRYIPDGREDQADLEHRSCHSRSAVAAERV
jgi:hypothetical protein